MKYRIVYGSDFEKAVLKQDKAVRQKLETALTQLTVNPFDSRLHTKPLAGELKGFFSLRIGRRVRVIFLFSNTDIHLLKIAKREDVYRK